jgi:glycosyltransferase involved in cell wall biosynthesis
MSRLIETTIAYQSSPSERAGTGVSVIVTLYDYADSVLNALESVHAQTHENLELIVVDDGSRDASRAVTEQWMKSKGTRFSRAALVAHRENYGLAQARNTAFEKASNEFVFVLDADNEIYPSAITSLLSACQNAQAQGAYSQIERFGDETGPGAADVWNPARLSYGNYIDAMALVRKSSWRAAGGYQVFDIPGWEDYDLWCRFVELGFKMVFVPQLLCRYRVHTRSMLRRQTNPNLKHLIAEMLFRHPWLELK